jgi:RNA polymerase sigma factor (sigma-70 family)
MIVASDEETMRAVTREASYSDAIKTAFIRSIIVKPAVKKHQAKQAHLQNIDITRYIRELEHDFTKRLDWRKSRKLIRLIAVVLKKNLSTIDDPLASQKIARELEEIFKEVGLSLNMAKVMKVQQIDNCIWQVDLPGVGSRKKEILPVAERSVDIIKDKDASPIKERGPNLLKGHSGRVSTPVIIGLLIASTFIGFLALFFPLIKHFSPGLIAATIFTLFYIGAYFINIYVFRKFNPVLIGTVIALEAILVGFVIIVTDGALAVPAIVIPIASTLVGLMLNIDPLLETINRAKAIKKLTKICDHTLKNNKEGIIPFQTTMGGGIFLGSDLETVAKIFEKIKLKEGMKFLDVGSGDGRVVLLAALFGAQASGVEQDKRFIKLVQMSSKQAAEEKIINPQLIDWQYKNVMDMDISDFDIIFLYEGGLSVHKEDIEEKVIREAKDSVLVVIRHEGYLPLTRLRAVRKLSNLYRREFPGAYSLYVKDVNKGEAKKAVSSIRADAEGGMANIVTVRRWIETGDIDNLFLHLTRGLQGASGKVLRSHIKDIAIGLSDKKSGDVLEDKFLELVLKLKGLKKKVIGEAAYNHAQNVLRLLKETKLAYIVLKLNKGDISLFRSDGPFTFSNLIRISTQGPVNHGAISIGKRWVVHALGRGVIKQRLAEYLKQIGYLDNRNAAITVVRLKPEVFKDEDEYRSAIGIASARAESFVGRKYDWAALIGIGWGVLWRGLFRIVGLGKANFAHNLLQHRMDFYCFELVAECFKDTSSITRKPFFAGEVYEDNPTGKDILKSGCVKYVIGKWYSIVGQLKSEDYLSRRIQACGLGVYGPEGRVDARAQKKVKRIIEKAKREDRLVRYQELNVDRKGEIKLPPQILSLIDKDNIYLLLPDSGITSRGPPAIIWHERQRRFLIAGTYDSTIILPYTLVTLLTQANREDLLRKIIAHEERHLVSAREDTKEAEKLARDVIENFPREKPDSPNQEKIYQRIAEEDGLALARRILEESKGKNWKKHHLLTRKEEVKLFMALETRDDLAEKKDIRDCLILCNMGLVGEIAKKISSYARRVPREDLFQYGVFGLFTAIEKFEYKRGNKFSTYASHWIRQSMMRETTEKERTIRLPVHIMDKKTKLSHHTQRFFQEYGRDPSYEELARVTKISEKTIIKVMGLKDVISLDVPIGEEKEDTLLDLLVQESISSPLDSTKEALLRDILGKTLRELKPIERIVLVLYFGLYSKSGKIKTLEEVGNMLCLTRERIRQIKDKAMISFKRILGIHAQNKKIIRANPLSNANTEMTREVVFRELLDILAKSSGYLTIERLSKALLLILSDVDFTPSVAQHMKKLAYERRLNSLYGKSLWQAIQQLHQKDKAVKDYFGIYFLVRLCKAVNKTFLLNKNIAIPDSFAKAITEYSAWEKENINSPLLEKAKEVYAVYLRNKLNMNHKAICEWMAWSAIVAKTIIKERETQRAAERMILILALNSNYFIRLSYENKVIFLSAIIEGLSQKHTLKYGNKEGERDKLEVAAFRPVQGRFSRYLTPGVTIEEFVDAGKREDPVLNRAAYLFDIKLWGNESLIFKGVMVAYKIWEAKNYNTRLIIKTRKIWELYRSNRLRQQRGGLVNHWLTWMHLVNILLVKDLNTKRAIREIEAYLLENKKHFEELSYVGRIRFLISETDRIAAKYGLEYVSGEGERDKFELAVFRPMSTIFPKYPTPGIARIALAQERINKPDLLNKNNPSLYRALYVVFGIKMEKPIPPTRLESAVEEYKTWEGENPQLDLTDKIKKAWSLYKIYHLNSQKGGTIVHLNNWMQMVRLGIIKDTEVRSAAEELITYATSKLSMPCLCRVIAQSLLQKVDELSVEYQLGDKRCELEVAALRPSGNVSFKYYTPSMVRDALRERKNSGKENTLWKLQQENFSLYHAAVRRFNFIDFGIVKVDRHIDYPSWEIVGEVWAKRLKWRSITLSSVMRDNPSLYKSGMKTGFIFPAQNETFRWHMNVLMGKKRVSPEKRQLAYKRMMLLAVHSKEEVLRRWLKIKNYKRSVRLVKKFSQSEAGRIFDSTLGITPSISVCRANDHDITAKAMFEAAKKYQDEPYISTAFTKLGEIIFKAALVKYLMDSGKLTGPPKREGIETLISSLSTEQKEAIANYPLANNKTWNEYEKRKIEAILIQLGYPHPIVRWAVSSINLHEFYFREESAITAQAKRFRLEYIASLNNLHESLMAWNLKIYLLASKRMVYKNKGENQEPILKELDAVIQQIKKKLPYFIIFQIPQEIIIQITRALPFLERVNKEGMRSPNETPANVLLVSSISRLQKEKERFLRLRINQEKEGSWIKVREGKYLVREQVYRKIETAKKAILTYSTIPYHSLWQAFRAQDHQIDSELKEINWLSNCKKLLTELTNLSFDDADRIKKEIEDLLIQLKGIKVEEKKLARIVLFYAEELLGLERLKQLKGLLRLTQEFFSLRIKQSNEIIKGLEEIRLRRLRQFIDSRNDYFKSKTFKILRDLKYGHYGLSKIILFNDLFDASHKIYFNEPEFNSLFGPLKEFGKKFQRGALSEGELRQAKEVFELFRDKILTSEVLNKFMYAYRHLYIQSQLEGKQDIKTREDAFNQVFLEWYQRSNAVRGSPDLWWTIFYQAAFISLSDPFFFAISDYITQEQIKKAGYQRLERLLPQKVYLLSEEQKNEFYKATHAPNLDRAKPRPGHTQKEVIARFNELKARGFPGFKLVTGNEYWIKECLFDYDNSDRAQAEFLRVLIRHGYLRVGPDEKKIFYGANDNETYLIATNKNPHLASTLIHELNGKSHRKNLLAEHRFKIRKKLAGKKQAKIQFTNELSWLIGYIQHKYKYGYLSEYGLEEHLEQEGKKALHNSWVKSGGNKNSKFSSYASTAVARRVVKKHLREEINDFTHWFRDDWVPEDKLNKAISRLTEAAVKKYLRRAVSDYARHIRQPGYISIIEAKINEAIRKFKARYNNRDFAKPRPGHSKGEVAARFNELKAQGFSGFKPVSGNERWVKEVLNYYYATDKAKAKFLRTLIKQGRLRAGPDEKKIFYGVNDRDVYLIATNENPDLASTGIHEINGKSHLKNLLAEYKFKAYRKLAGFAKLVRIVIPDKREHKLYSEKDNFGLSLQKIYQAELSYAPQSKEYNGFHRLRRMALLEIAVVKYLIHSRRLVILPTRKELADLIRSLSKKQVRAIMNERVVTIKTWDKNKEEEIRQILKHLSYSSQKTNHIIRLFNIWAKSSKEEKAIENLARAFRRSSRYILMGRRESIRFALQEFSQRLREKAALIFEALKFIKNEIALNKLLRQFIRDCHSLYKEAQSSQEISGISSKQDAFFREFLEYYRRYDLVRDTPNLWWTRGYQREFVTHSTQLYSALSHYIIQTQIEKTGYKYLRDLFFGKEFQLSEEEKKEFLYATHWPYEDLDVPPLLMCSEPGSAASNRVSEKEIRAIKQVLKYNAYRTEIENRLKMFLYEAQQGTLNPVMGYIPEWDFWSKLAQAYKDKRYTELPLLFAASYFYIRILEAVRYFYAQDHKDPFERIKLLELEGDYGAINMFISEYSYLEGEKKFIPEEVLFYLVLNSLWGNRLDLSNATLSQKEKGELFALSRDKKHKRELTNKIIIDDSMRLIEVLTSKKIDRLDLITDNFGHELIFDLYLIDYLLRQGLVKKAYLHLKDKPFLVSDALIKDVYLLIRRLKSDPNSIAGDFAKRLEAYLKEEKIILKDHSFWTRPLAFEKMPADLMQDFIKSDFVLIKGDLNYSKLIDCRYWPYNSRLEDLTAYFPTSFAVLRTLKTELIVGLTIEQVEELFKQDYNWRSNGKWAIIQLLERDKQLALQGQQLAREIEREIEETGRSFTDKQATKPKVTKTKEPEIDIYDDEIIDNICFDAGIIYSLGQGLVIVLQELKKAEEDLERFFFESPSGNINQNEAIQQAFERIIKFTKELPAYANLCYEEEDTYEFLKKEILQGMINELDKKIKKINAEISQIQRIDKDRSLHGLQSRVTMYAKIKENCCQALEELDRLVDSIKKQKGKANEKD